MHPKNCVCGENQTQPSNNKNVFRKHDEFNHERRKKSCSRVNDFVEV